MGTGDLQLCKCLLYIYICFFSHTINSINCMSNSIDYDEQSVSSDKIVPLKSISIPPAAMKSERLVWQAPGCHRIGITRIIKIPGCVKFSVTTNACRGYCLSYSVPSGAETLAINPKQVITSVGQCCNIMETVDIIAKDVLCHDGSDSNNIENWIPQDIVFKSALSCGCLSCKKD